MFRILGGAACLLVGLISISEAQSEPSNATVRESDISASGRGEVRLAPDYAYVTLGVTTQSPSGSQTASQNAAKMAAIVSALKALGLTDQQVVTSGYSLTQNYEYPKNKPPQLSGFTARNTIRAEVRRLDDLGKVIDAAINAGATDVSSIQYLPTSSEEARRTALASAVQQARSDADAMARAAGGTLGRLLSMNTTGIAQPMPLRATYLESVVATAGSSGMPTQITPGELNVVATVFTRWEFLPGRSR
jgi:uncharacterized protein YggE